MTASDVHKMIWEQAETMMLGTPPTGGGFIVPFIDVAGVRIPIIRDGIIRRGI